MASLFSGCTFGDIQAMLQNLASEGFYAKKAERVKKHRYLAKVMVEALDDRWLYETLDGLDRLLKDVEDQKARLIEKFSHRGLKEGDFAHLDLSSSYQWEQHLSHLRFLYHTTGNSVEDLRLAIQDFETCGFEVNN